jgi:flap endonuclease-1
MNMTEFIDTCILCGCDYTNTIAGMGPVTAFKMIKECGDIEGVLEKVNEINDDPAKKKKYSVPKEFLYKESRLMFTDPEVNNNKEELKTLIKFEKPYEEELRDFLINHKGFTEVKVNNGLERL